MYYRISGIALLETRAGIGEFRLNGAICFTYMMKRTEPAHAERLGVIIVMRVDASRPADFARTAH